MQEIPLKVRLMKVKLDGRKILARVEELFEGVVRALARTPEPDARERRLELLVLVCFERSEKVKTLDV